MADAISPKSGAQSKDIEFPGLTERRHIDSAFVVEGQTIYRNWPDSSQLEQQCFHPRRLRRSRLPHHSHEMIDLADVLTFADHPSGQKLLQLQLSLKMNLEGVK